jgi:hypothetical protein
MVTAMRIRLLVAAAALLIPLAAAQPASAGLPAGCHIDAGKVAAATSHANRSVDVRWPGMACSTARSLQIRAKLHWRVGTVWYFSKVPFYAVSGSGTTLPGATVTTSCPHRDLVYVEVAYLSGSGSVEALTNQTICS